MYIPSDSWTADPAISAVFKGGSDNLKNGGWSSLIGVVTAIVGNVLISFALNTQRYAHIRMSRDREAKQQEKRKSARRQKKSADYGTQQREVAEERAEQNRKAEISGGRLEEQEGAIETQPLIPKLDSSQASSSSFSEELTQDEKDGDEVEEKSYLKSPIWWLGIAMMVLGETGNFLAYGFAPASIVSPLGVVALISNCLIAPLLLKEKFRIRDGLGVLIAVGGAVVVVLSASDSNPKLTPDAIWALVTTWEFETYLGVTAFLIIALTVLSNKYGHKTIVIDLGLVGLYGGYTALSTKGVASLLTYSLYKVVTFPITYLLVTVLVFTAVMQIKYVNRALQRFNSTMVIPTQFVMFTISVIIGSAVLYRDFERESPEDAGKFVGGCALTFFGVWCITSGRKSEHNDDYEDDEEDTISLVDEEGVMPEIRENDDPSRNVSLVASSLNAPSLRRAQTTEAGSLLKVHIRAPTFGSTPPGALDWNKYIPEMQPGTASAVHRDPAQLNGKENADPKKPIMHATTSAPIIPQTPSASLRPKTPLTRTPSGPAERLSPQRSPLNRGQTAEPVGPHRLLERTSSLRLGPLTSPLSGSLAAIVADELRRGADKSPLGSIRRRTSHRPQQGRRPTDQNEDSRPLMSSSLKRHSIASTDMEFESREAADLRTAAGSPPGRVRSLSATISDMFGSSSGSTLKRQRTLERDRKKAADSAVPEESSSRQNGGR
ncbi:Putative magnesium transporter NIPA [Septoria linicola]|uniref:Magnesium transporter NIPA n=1 Tax=Septoria linicola TaxID=215465 RepID=A0A9Q9ARM5_9PEZI|nr:putative magnesium transporter NIPA [Septoria linicola]USW51265.1 Putative magnesium transporter NIPA [Septoria linicola]